MEASFAKGITEGPVLNNGVKMPWLGLGVWRAQNGDEVINAVKAAVRHGYRSIDTASYYKNEEGVGAGIRECGIPRKELFITTKVWNTQQGYENTLRAFNESLKKMQLEYLDLYLMHWAVPGKFLETWRAMIHLYREGYVRAIGVSNHLVHHLKELVEDSGLVPAVNQIECHPLLTQKETIAYCQQNNIRCEAWRPLIKGQFDYPVLAEIARRRHRTIPQIILRWHIQNGVAVIPKSVHEERIAENARIFDFYLSQNDMQSIDRMNIGKRFGEDPDTPPLYPL